MSIMLFVRVQILGCGNILKGDDGFGPAVAQYIEQNYQVHKNVLIVDAGMACGEWIMPLAHDDQRPNRLIIVDVIDLGLDPGTIRTLKPDDLKLLNTSYSSHFFPDKETFKELIDLGMDILFVSCQLRKIPRGLSMNLSPELREIVPKVAKRVADLAGLTLI